MSSDYSYDISFFKMFATQQKLLRFTELQQELITYFLCN